MQRKYLHLITTHTLLSSNICVADRFEGDNYILDFQVVRAAVKAFKAYSSSLTSAAVPKVSLSPFTNFLRHLSESRQEREGTRPAELDSWHNPHTAVYLLELRALCVVRDYARHEREPDANVAQRVAKAVTEAFVAVQVEQFIRDAPRLLPGQEAHIVADLLLLVSL